jgi:hypothetical protein
MLDIVMTNIFVQSFVESLRYHLEGKVRLVFVPLIQMANTSSFY